MKKLFFLMFALVGFAFGADSELISSYTTIAVYSIIGGSVVLGIAALGGALGMGNAASATISGIARNPSISTKLSTTMYISLAMIEAQVIYALVVCFILLFGNPFITDALEAVVS